MKKRRLNWISKTLTACAWARIRKKTWNCTKQGFDRWIWSSSAKIMLNDFASIAYRAIGFRKNTFSNKISYFSRDCRRFSNLCQKRPDSVRHHSSSSSSNDEERPTLHSDKSWQLSRVCYLRCGGRCVRLPARLPGRPVLELHVSFLSSKK